MFSQYQQMLILSHEVKLSIYSRSSNPTARNPIFMVFFFMLTFCLAVCKFIYKWLQNPESALRFSGYYLSGM